VSGEHRHLSSHTPWQTQLAFAHEGRDRRQGSYPCETRPIAPERHPERDVSACCGEEDAQAHKGGQVDGELLDETPARRIPERRR